MTPNNCHSDCNYCCCPPTAHALHSPWEAHIAAELKRKRKLTVAASCTLRHPLCLAYRSRFVTVYADGTAGKRWRLRRENGIRAAEMPDEWRKRPPGRTPAVDYAALARLWSGPSCAPVARSAQLHIKKLGNITAWLPPMFYRTSHVSLLNFLATWTRQDPRLFRTNFSEAFLYCSKLWNKFFF